MSTAILRSAWLNGVPYCRLWLIMVPNRRSPSEVDAKFSNASMRFGNIRRSSRRRCNTQAIAGLVWFISSATRRSPLSMPIPASLHTTSKSIISGVPSRMAASKRRFSTDRINRGPRIPITTPMSVKTSTSAGGLPENCARSSAMTGNKNMLTTLTPIQVGKVR